MTSRNSVLISVAEHKNGRTYEKSIINVKGNNVPKKFRSCTYGSHFRAVVIKHAKQTTVKQQKNTVHAKANSKRWKQEKSKLVNSMRKLLFEQIQRQKGSSFSCIIITQ